MVNLKVLEKIYWAKTPRTDIIRSLSIKLRMQGYKVHSYTIWYCEEDKLYYYNALVYA